MSVTRRVPCPEGCDINTPHAHYEQDFRMNFKEVCPNCGATEQDLAKVKGCVRCLKCGWKQDCNGW